MLRANGIQAEDYTPNPARMRSFSHSHTPYTYAH